MGRKAAPLEPPPAIKCQHCQRKAAYYRTIISSGVEVVTARCECGQTPIPGQPFFSKKKYAWGDLPLVDDLSLSAEPCARCGSKVGTQYHHWAPKHLFHEDADSWPGSYLCIPCHRLWHSVVTPNMIQVGKNEKHA